MPSSPFGLSENPFVEGHDSRFVYPSRAHREVVARLRCGIENREPFALVTGLPGAGKTIAVQAALTDAGPRTLVLIAASPSLSHAKFRERIVSGFAQDAPDPVSPPRSADGIEARLRAVRASGRMAFLVVDEAQNLGLPLLEDLRLLSNLETDGHNLVQIILAGQPRLEEGLSRPGCDALRQRIAVRCRLGTLSAEETGCYIRHRVSVAGGDPESLFTSESCQAVHRLAHGIPREINLLAGEALMLAHTAGESAITAGHVACAAVLLGFRSVVQDPQPRADTVTPANMDAVEVVPCADAGSGAGECEEPEAGPPVSAKVSAPASCEASLAGCAVESPPAAAAIPEPVTSGDPLTASTAPAGDAAGVTPARLENPEVAAWLARFRGPDGPPRIGSRLAAEAMASAALEARTGGAGDKEQAVPARPRHTHARGALPRRRASRGGHAWWNAPRMAGALLLVAVAGFVLSTSGRSLMRARPAARAEIGTTAGKVDRTRTLNASAVRPALVAVRPTSAPKITPVPQTPSPVPAALGPAPAPPARRYGVEVATFIVESRALEERDRLAARISLPCGIATSLQDGAEVYSLVVGPVASRAEAARLSEDLSGRRLVGEARVVRWAASDSTRR